MAQPGGLFSFGFDDEPGTTSSFSLGFEDALANAGGSSWGASNDPKPAEPLFIGGNNPEPSLSPASLSLPTSQPSTFQASPVSQPLLQPTKPLQIPQSLQLPQGLQLTMPSEQSTSPLMLRPNKPIEPVVSFQPEPVQQPPQLQPPALQFGSLSPQSDFSSLLLPSQPPPSYSQASSPLIPQSISPSIPFAEHKPSPQPDPFPTNLLLPSEPKLTPLSLTPTKTPEPAKPSLQLPGSFASLTLPSSPLPSLSTPSLNPITPTPSIPLNPTPLVPVSTTFSPVTNLPSLNPPSLEVSSLLPLDIVTSSPVTSAPPMTNIGQSDVDIKRLLSLEEKYEQQKKMLTETNTQVLQLLETVKLLTNKVNSLEFELREVKKNDSSKEVPPVRALHSVSLTPEQPRIEQHPSSVDNLLDLKKKPADRPALANPPSPMYQPLPGYSSLQPQPLPVHPIQTLQPQFLQTQTGVRGQPVFLAPQGVMRGPAGPQVIQTQRGGQPVLFQAVPGQYFAAPPAYSPQRG